MMVWNKFCYRPASSSPSAFRCLSVMTQIWMLMSDSEHIQQNCPSLAPVRRGFMPVAIWDGHKGQALDMITREPVWPSGKAVGW